MADDTKSKRGRRRRLTAEERTIEERLSRFPLASGQNLDRIYREEYITRKRTLTILKEDGLVGGMDCGFTRRRQPRYWSIDRSAGWDPDDPQPKHPHLVHTLLSRLALLESVYFIIEDALQKKPGRKLVDFAWRFESAIDATVRFNDGWMVFVWSGIWKDGKSVSHLVLDLFDNLKAWGRAGPKHNPGKTCVIVPDLWQAELVRRGIEMFGFPENSLIHVAGASFIDDDYDLSGSRGWPPRADMSRWARPPDRLHRLVRELAARDNARDLLRFLTTVEQWPGVVRGTLRDLTKLNGKSIAAAEDWLIESGLIWRTSNGGFAADKDWLSIAARRDRVWSGRPGQMFSREKVDQLYTGRIGTHEKGVAALAGWFSAAGCPVAPGWRFHDVMGSRGQVAPDAMILVDRSPFGPTWFHVEYELSAKAKGRLGKKFRGYHSPSRSDDFPLMGVCKREAMQNFIDLGPDRMLVAAVEDVRRSNVVGDSETVWLYLGRPVEGLGALRRPKRA